MFFLKVQLRVKKVIVVIVIRLDHLHDVICALHRQPAVQTLQRTPA